MRPVWKGALSFGLVTIPVGMYPATARNDVSFRLLHAKDKSPIAYRRVCAEENVEVPWAEIVKGYEYEKGRFVEMTAAEIPPAYFEQPYYLAPEKTGGKAYALLREALRRSGRAGVATVVLRQREHLAAVQTRGDALTLTTMRFAHEIVEPTGLDLPADAGLDRREVDLALQLVGTLEGPWQPDKYRDRYRDALMATIERKVADLMSALEASLKAQPKREPARAAGRRETAAARRPSSRRRAS